MGVQRQGSHNERVRGEKKRKKLGSPEDHQKKSGKPATPVDEGKPHDRKDRAAALDRTEEKSEKWVPRNGWKTGATLRRKQRNSSCVSSCKKKGVGVRGRARNEVMEKKQKKPCHGWTNLCRREKKSESREFVKGGPPGKCRGKGKQEPLGAWTCCTRKKAVQGMKRGFRTRKLNKKIQKAGSTCTSKSNKRTVPEVCESQHAEPTSEAGEERETL